jgi:hypothetical protein
MSPAFCRRAAPTGFVEVVGEDDLLCARDRRIGVPANDVQKQALCSRAAGQKKGARDRQLRSG